MQASNNQSPLIGRMSGVEEMSEQIDWSKAPEGATHYSPEIPGLACAAFWRENNGRLVEFWGVGGGTFKHRVNAEGYCKTPDECIQRPTTPSWSGEGLPPVGVVCEANFVGEWKRFEMRYYGEAYVVFKTAFEVQRARHDFDTCGVKFRPIRTPEQIAADEREAAIKAIVGLIESADSRDMTIAEAIYNAGYRKEQK